MQKLAIVGATGAVGKEFLRVLEKRRFPVSSIKLLASRRSVGKKLEFQKETVPIEELKKDSFRGVDLALFSAGAEISREYADKAVQSGAVVVDNSSAFRMEESVPLVVPEINPEKISEHSGIIANPNCTSMILLMGVYPIYRLSRVRRMVVSTYQAVSGSGIRALEELLNQSRDYLDELNQSNGSNELNAKKHKPTVFAHPIAFNLFSHDSTVGSDGYNGEEKKVMQECQKILGDSELKISVTAVRVPVLRSHSESVNLELEKKLSLDEIRESIRSFSGVKLVDYPEKNYFPMPLDASGRDEVLVGRIREDYSCENGISLFISGDQLLKGAALNAVQIAEQLL